MSDCKTNRENTHPLLIQDFEKFANVKRKKKQGTAHGPRMTKATGKDLCLQHVPYVIRRLRKWLGSRDPVASLGAAKLLLAYGLGKPKETVELQVPNGKPYAYMLPADAPAEHWAQLVDRSIVDAKGEVVEDEPDAGHA